MMGTFRGVFFDLFGTLLVYGDMSAAWSDWLAAFYNSLKVCGLSMSKEAFALQCDGFFSRPEPPVRDDGLTVFECRIQALAKDTGLDLQDRDIHSTATVCLNAWQAHISLDQSALPVLETLKPEHTLALISNFDHPPHVYSLLSTLGLAEFFDAVLVSGDTGVKKPDPRIFALALKRTQLQPHEAVYVGDTSEDIRGARAAGLCPVLIQRSELNSNQVILDFRSTQQPLVCESEVPTSAEGTRTIPELTVLPGILK